MYTAERGRTNRGSMTIEVSIVIPLVIFSVVLLIYMALLVHQHFFLQSLADRAAERGAAVWNHPEKEMPSGALQSGDHDTALYWRISDPDKDKKIAGVRDYVLSNLQSKVFMPVTKPRVNVEFSDFFVYKKLKVEIERSYLLPAAGFLRMFGMSDRYVVKVRSEATVNEPVELIRNTDLVIDLERQLEEQFPALKSVREKVAESLKKAADSVEKLIRE